MLLPRADRSCQPVGVPEATERMCTRVQRTKQAEKSGAVRRHTLLAGGIAALVVGLAACGSSGGTGSGHGTSSGPIVVGTSTSMTGAAAAVCSPLTAGEKAWFTYANSHGGVAGRQVKLTVLDDGGDPSRAVGNAKTLISDGAAAVVGGCGSAPAAALASYLNAHQVPYLFPYGSLSMTPAPKYVFALFPPYAPQEQALIPEVMKKYGKGSLYAIVVTIPDESSIASAIKQSTKSVTGSTPQVATMPIAPPDVSPYVLKYASTRAPYLVLVLNASDGARVVKELADRNELPQHILSFTGMASEAYFSNIPAAAQGLNELPSPVAPAGSSGAKQCEAAFVASKVPESVGALEGCAQAQAVIATLKASGSDLSPGHIVSTLESFSSKDVGGVLPPLTFTSTNHVGERSLFLCTVKNGKLQEQSLMAMPASS